MKIRTTQKAIKNTFGRVLKLSFCGLQSVLRAADLAPIAYTARAEGWASDVYDVSDYAPGTLAISTGYQPFGTISPDYETTDLAEKIARALLEWGTCDLDPLTADPLDFCATIKLRTDAGRQLLRATLSATLSGDAIAIPDVATIEHRYFAGLYSLADRRALLALRAAINSAGVSDRINDGHGVELPF